MDRESWKKPYIDQRERPQDIVDEENSREAQNAHTSNAQTATFPSSIYQGNCLYVRSYNPV